MDKDDVRGLLTVLTVVVAICLTTLCVYSLMFRGMLNKIDALEQRVDEMKADAYLRQFNPDFNHALGGRKERRNDGQR